MEDEHFCLRAAHLAVRAGRSGPGPFCGRLQMEMGKMVEQTLNGSLKTSAWGSDKVEALLSVEPGSDAAIAGISQHWGLLARVVTKEYGGDTKWGFVRQYVSARAPAREQCMQSQSS